MRPYPFVLLLVGLFPASLHAVQMDSTPPRRSLVALGQTLALNTLVNRVDAWVRNRAWARVGTRAWGRNIQYGWDWDEDAFPTNMFAHPYHGSLYFNAGRSNGLGFFESVPLAFLGSWTWEYFAETERPSLNDFLMSSFGGVEIGEIFRRI